MSQQISNRVIPQATDLESHVLGAIMQDANAIFIVSSILTAEDFYLPKNKEVYRAIESLFSSHHPIDLATVAEKCIELDVMNSIGGAEYLVQLTNEVASAANIEYHSRLIKQKAIKRALIIHSNALNTECFDPGQDAIELIEKAQNTLFQITESTFKSGGATAISDVLLDVTKEIEAAANKEEGLIGIPTGLTDIDRHFNGLRAPDCMVLAARPGMGKTAFVLAIARNAAVDHNVPVAIFSLEMTKSQLTKRLISIESEISGKKVKDGKLTDADWEDYHRALNRLENAPILMDDTSTLPVNELRTKARMLVMQHDVKLIVVDYLQLMIDPSEKGNREQVVSSISRKIKGIAKELKVAVILLAQLSRKVEDRGGSKRPMLSDLRESGSIEQDADQVCFLYRPEYYGIKEDEEGQSLKGCTEFIIAKYREGETRTIKLKFLDHIAKFTDYENDDFNGITTLTPIKEVVNNIQANLITGRRGADDPPF